MVKAHIRIIFLFSFFIFIINKVYIRKLVVQDKLPKSIEILSYSIPNFLEAVMGTSLLVVILLILKRRMTYLEKVKDLTVILTAIALSSVFVITQELKYHNIGGRNVYDSNDLIASILGLLFIAYVIVKFGILNTPKAQN